MTNEYEIYQQIITQAQGKLGGLLQVKQELVDRMAIINEQIAQAQSELDIIIGQLQPAIDKLQADMPKE